MSIRTQQLNSIILQDIAKFIVQNSEQQEYIISIIAVETTADAKRAVVSFNVFPSTDKFYRKASSFLGRKCFEMAQIIGSTHKLKFTPHLFFKIEKPSENLSRIEKLLNEIKNE